VGDNQLPRVEQNSKLLHRFVKTVDRPVLVECDAVLSQVARLPGIDRKAKMSKSLKSHYPPGELGDSVVKRVLNERLQSLIEPNRARCRELAGDRAEALAIPHRGTMRAREMGEPTLSEVKSALGSTYIESRRAVGYGSPARSGDQRPLSGRI
jgi:tryptophanyl-tRNA synthetase